jgi:hypothetical protein
MDETGLDVEALQDSVRGAYEQRPQWRADPADRRSERGVIAAAHRAIYESVLR